MDWLNACRLIVTNDSLGMHLAIALKKKVVALFGPTSCREVYLYGRGVILLPRDTYGCIPCLESRCVQKTHCMEFIRTEEVKNAIMKLLPKKGK